MLSSSGAFDTAQQGKPQGLMLGVQKCNDKAMTYLIWNGAAVTLFGLAGLCWCIYFAQRARKKGLDDEEMKAQLQRLVAVNMGALLLSVIGVVNKFF